MTMKLFEESYIDGCSVHLPTWAGLSLTEQEEDRLWAHTNETSLIEEAGGYVDVDESVEDAPPGMNDTYYSVYCDDKETFRNGLRDAILRRIGGA